MTTSAVFTKTVGTVIEQALRKARLIAVEQPVRGIDYQRGKEALNNIASHRQNHDINLWLEREAVLPLVPNQQEYDLAPRS